MKKALVIIIFVFIGTSQQLQAQATSEILNRTVEAMGGLEKWQNLEYIRMKYAGHKYWLEQSENPNGPFITSYELVNEVRGIHEPKLSRNETTHHFQAPDGSKSDIIMNGSEAVMKFGERTFPMPKQLRVGHDEWLRYAPEYLVLSALKENATLKEPVLLDGTPHYTLSFTKNKLEHQLFINKHTNLITQAQIDSFLPYDIFNYPWGKFTTTIKYSLHWLYTEEIRYPAQWDIYKLGKHYRSLTILDIEFLSKIDPETFKIPADLPGGREAVMVDDTSLNTDGIVQVAPGIHTIPGMWYVGHIEQEDGIVVIEAPISSGYNHQHIEFLTKKYPNKPIKAVISTSDAWPHIGGIREFAAIKKPIYTHYLNQEIITKVLKADHSPNPDAYQQVQAKPIFQSVNEILEINDPDLPFELVPVNGEGGERMIMIYFPKQKVLYASDLVQLNQRTNEFFSPQYLTEVYEAVKRHQLEVETVFAMHTSPLPWSRVLEAMKNNSK